MVHPPNYFSSEPHPSSTNPRAISKNLQACSQLSNILKVPSPKQKLGVETMETFYQMFLRKWPKTPIFDTMTLDPENKDFFTTLALS